MNFLFPRTSPSLYLALWPHHLHHWITERSIIVLGSILVLPFTLTHCGQVSHLLQDCLIFYKSGIMLPLSSVTGRIERDSPCESTWWNLNSLFCSRSCSRGELLAQVDFSEPSSLFPISPTPTVAWSRKLPDRGHPAHAMFLTPCHFLTHLLWSL